MNRLFTSIIYFFLISIITCVFSYANIAESDLQGFKEASLCKLDPLGLCCQKQHNVYSVAFEIQLKPADFGRSRSLHFNRANAALDKVLKNDPGFKKMMESLIPDIEKYVSKSGGRQTPPGWIWEHASTSTTGGKKGIMRLVPREQHTPGSKWWRALHPDKGARGGYSEWAIPAGAPKNR